MEKRDNILIGSGELYLTSFSGTEIPEDATIEVDANCVGDCSSGFEVSYSPSIKQITNQYGDVVKQFIESEEVVCKTGIMTWDLANLKKFSSGEITKNSTTQTFTIGGKKTLETLLVRFVHEKEDGKKIRFTMVGQASNGFTINFVNDAVTVDAEIKAIKKIKNLLCKFDEEIEAGA